MLNNTDVGSLEQGTLTITPTTKDEYVDDCYSLVEDTAVFTTGIDDVIEITAAAGTSHTKVYNLTTEPADATITSNSSATGVATATMGSSATAHQLTITGVAAGSAIVTLTASKSNYASFKRTILVIVK